MTTLPLEQSNPHWRDAMVSFDEPAHQYTIVRGGEAQLAICTASEIGKRYFQPFDGNATVEKYYESWKQNCDSKYHAIIHTALASGLDTEQVKQLIATSWKEKGEAASKLGTKMHSDFELIMNNIDPVLACAECDLLKKWLREFEPENQWQPFRSEWVVWYDSDPGDPRSPIVVAGTIDAVLYSPVKDTFAVFDWKRVNPAPKRPGAAPNLLGPNSMPWKYADQPLGIEDSQFGKYSVQLNVYAKILRDRYGIDVGCRMYLAQFYAGMQAAHSVRVPVMRDETNALFVTEAERQRLALDQTGTCAYRV